MKERIDLLFKALESAGFAPWWDEDAYNTIVVSSVKDRGVYYEIVESAAPGYFGAKRDIPFNEPEYFALNGIQAVLELVNEDVEY